LGKLIGVFATEISSRIQGELYTILHKKATECGYNLVFFSANLERLNSSGIEEDSLFLFEMAERMDFSAFIVHALSIGSRVIIDYIIAMGKRKNIPIIIYDCDDYDFSDEDGVVVINLDYKQGFAEGVKHVLDYHNCKNVYMLAGMKGNEFSEDRIDVYKREMAARGLSVTDDMIMYGDFWELPAEAAINYMIDSGIPMPEAICCANDSMAIAAAKALENRGYKVPEDVIITGFDGIDDGKYNVPVIATCEPRLELVPDYIFKCIEQDVRSDVYFVPFMYVPKESCGCENEHADNDRRNMAKMMENIRQNSWHHSMLSNMQLELIDSNVINDINEYMCGIVKLYKGFSHIYCIRDDIECVDDCTGAFDKLRIQMNIDFMPDKDYGVFNKDEVFPGYSEIVGNADKDEMFIFRMLQSVHKKFGFCVTRSKFYSSNEIKVFAQFAESYTNMLESVLRNKRLTQANQKLSEMYERMSEIYIRDMMTGLYNRTGYYNELNEYVKREDISQGYIHVVSVDMDGMKQINDNYGHQEGDNAIKAVAKSINDCFAQPCICARFGGDEFMVSLFTANEDKPSTEQISERLNKYLKSLAMLQDKEYSVGVSVGHAVLKVSDMKDIKTLEKIADDFMYVDKRKRKGNKEVR